MSTMYKTNSFGKIDRLNHKNQRPSYQHQKKAKSNLDLINKKDSFSTLVVLPTGGGKTYTAATWLLKNAIDKRKKVMWIAHRQMLIEQALETFKVYPYIDYLPNISSFNFRIISGHKDHDKMINISPDDDILFVSKDSAGKNLETLNKWIKDENEVYLVIDEAHHSTAKTYRRIIDYFHENVENVKIIGLTATPMRSSPKEQGLLGQLFPDGIVKPGICYEVSLKELMRKQILSIPTRESTDTEIEIGNLSAEELKKIRGSDILPQGLIEKLNNESSRNRLIVDKYLSNKDKYGQTLVFAMDRTNAIALNKVFQQHGVKSNYVISSVQNDLGIPINQKHNDEVIRQFKNKEIQVLINVNILTEGADIPQTKTVFLTRPTTSIIRMTQMVGRALRGVKAGGTKEAYIISFVDKWEDKVAWVTPDLIFNDDEFPEVSGGSADSQVALIAISKIEEFAKILDDSIDTSLLESVAFEKRIPLGMYSFTYEQEGGSDYSHQVMVYDSTKKSYDEFMQSLKSIFEKFNVDDEYLSDETLTEIADYVEEQFFTDEMIPPYDENDIKQILKYYASQSVIPEFYTLNKIYRDQLDISKIVDTIIENNYSRIDERTYILSKWNESDKNILNIFFSNNFDIFAKEIEIEINKRLNQITPFNNVHYGEISEEQLTLQDLKEKNPVKAQLLKDKVYNKSLDSKGYYTCQNCGKKSDSKRGFEIDHIKPMNKGGLTVEDNLQLLCIQCNRLKGDKIE